jgi:hypothetical protein
MIEKKQCFTAIFLLFLGVTVLSTFCVVYAAEPTTLSGGPAEESIVSKSRTVAIQPNDGIPEGPEILPAITENSLTKSNGLNDSMLQKVAPETTSRLSISDRLARLSVEEKEAAAIDIEIDESLLENEKQELLDAQSLWSSGAFDEAIAIIDRFEATGKGLNIGIAWNTPRDVILSKDWSNNDGRIGTLNNVYDAHLDFDAQTGHLFAVLKHDDGDEFWTVNISTDKGRTWQETYSWATALYEIPDIDAVVVGDYLWIAYLYSAAPNSVRMRRFQVSDGAVDNVYGYQEVFNRSVEVSEVSLTSNADDADNRVYVSAIRTDNSLLFYWADTYGTSWDEVSTGITDASTGLDITWNSLYDDYLFFLSYIGTGTGNPIIVCRCSTAGSWDSGTVLLSEYTGSQFRTSISAYDDTVICMYEHDYGVSEYGIRYNISYNGGDAWSWADLKIPDEGDDYWSPEVTARGGQGTACIYQKEAGAFDPIEFRYRSGYGSGPWQTVEQINDQDVYTGSPLAISWLPPNPGNTYSYGAIYISEDPDFRTPYFDRSDVVNTALPSVQLLLLGD